MSKINNDMKNNIRAMQRKIYQCAYIIAGPSAQRKSRGQRAILYIHIYIYIYI